MKPFAPAKTDLDAAVRSLVNSAIARVLTREQSPVTWFLFFEVNGVLHRLNGTMEDAGVIKPWSLIVKVNHPPPDYEESDEAQWRREEFAYASGLLHPHDGFAIARCLAVTRPSAEETWLCLEDVEDEYGELLSIERHALAAHHLGVFNGSHLVKPDEAPAWLIKGWLPWLLPLTDADEASKFVRQPIAWEHPAVRTAFPSSVLSDLERLSHDAPDYFHKLEALPQSLCHLDPGRFNIRARKDVDGHDETVFLDWQMLAVGSLGTDLAMMNVLNLYRLYVSPDDAQRYSEITLNGYLGGLRKAGVASDLDEARFAYRAAAALRAGAIVRVIIQHLTEIGFDQILLSAWGERRGWSRDETLRAWGHNMRFLMALAE